MAFKVMSFDQMYIDLNKNIELSLMKEVPYALSKLEQESMIVHKRSGHSYDVDEFMRGQTRRSKSMRRRFELASYYNWVPEVIDLNSISKRGKTTFVYTDITRPRPSIFGTQIGYDALLAEWVNDNVIPSLPYGGGTGSDPEHPYWEPGFWDDAFDDDTKNKKLVKTLIGERLKSSGYNTKY